VVALTEVLFAVGGICACLTQHLLQQSTATAFQAENSWRYLMSFEALPGLVMLLGSLRCPESPHWLLRAGREAEAEEVLDIIYAPTRHAGRPARCNCETKNADLSDAREALFAAQPSGGEGGEAGGAGGVAELWHTLALLRSPERRTSRAVELILLMSTMPLVGIGAIPQQFVPLLLEGPRLGHSMKRDVLDVSKDTLHIDLACNLVYVLGSLITCVLLVDWLGRRALLTLCLLGSALGFAVDAYSQANPPSSGPNTLVLLGVILGYICRAMGVGPLHQVVGSEVVPSEFAARGKALYATSRRFTAFLFCLLFPPLMSAIGEQAMFGALAATTAMYSLLVFLRLPETSGYDVSEIEALLDGPAWIPLAPRQTAPRRSSSQVLRDGGARGATLTSGRANSSSYLPSMGDAA
jgi:hypothetical protein